MRDWNDVLPPRVAMSQNAYDRYQSAKRMREAGLTLKEMGKRLGVNPGRAAWIAVQFDGRPVPIEEYFADVPEYTRAERAKLRKCLKS